MDKGSYSWEEGFCHREDRSQCNSHSREVPQIHRSKRPLHRSKDPYTLGCRWRFRYKHPHILLDVRLLWDMECRNHQKSCHLRGTTGHICSDLVALVHHSSTILFHSKLLCNLQGFCRPQYHNEFRNLSQVLVLWLGIPRYSHQYAVVLPRNKN